MSFMISLRAHIGNSCQVLFHVVRLFGTLENKRIVGVAHNALTVVSRLMLRGLMSGIRRTFTLWT